MDAHAWDERYAATDLVWSAGPNQFVETWCADLPPGRAVDLACGEGRNALWLARRGWSVTAVDFSATGIDKGRRVAEAEGLRLDWQVADVTTWTGSAYDLAVVAYLHLVADERGAALRAAYDALVPGGTFLLVAHDATNLTQGTGGPQDPAVLMTADDVLADLEGRTFEIRQAGRVERVVAPDPSHLNAGEGDRVAYDCLVVLTVSPDRDVGSSGSGTASRA